VERWSGTRDCVEGVRGAVWTVHGWRGLWVIWHSVARQEFDEGEKNRS